MPYCLTRNENEILGSFKMATKDDGSTQSFSFKFAKSKKPSRLQLESSNRTFQIKGEDADDIDYVVSTEGKEFKRYYSIAVFRP